MSESNTVTITHSGRRILLRREPRRGAPYGSDREPEPESWSYQLDDGPCRSGYPRYTVARQAAMAEITGGIRKEAKGGSHGKRGK